MKNLPALAATLLTITALCLSGCAPAEDNATSSGAPIILGPDTLSPSNSDSATESASGASMYLQSFFNAVYDDMSDISDDLEGMDDKSVIRNFPRAMRNIDQMNVSISDSARLIRESAKNVSTIPNKGYISIDPKTAKTQSDGSVTVSGEDMFIIYREGDKYNTHKGLSMDSEDSLDDVFTMSKVGSSWKISKITF